MHITYTMGHKKGATFIFTITLANVDRFLADRTATQYDRLLAAACCLSVCLSVTLCILAFRVGVQG